VGRRTVTFALAATLLLAAWPAGRAAAQGPAPLRRNLPEAGKAGVELRAGRVVTWDGDGSRYLAAEDAVIRCGSAEVRAARAVIRVDATDDRPGAPAKGEMYVEGGVQVLSNGYRDTADTALLTYSSKGPLTVGGDARDKIERLSVANSLLFERYLLAKKGLIAPPEPPAVVARSPGAIVPVQATAPRPPKLDPVPGAPGGPVTVEPPTFETPAIPLPNVNTRRLKIANRSSNPTNAKYMNLANGDQIGLVTGGVKLLAFFDAAPGRPPNTARVLDVEADNLVVWQKGGKTSDLVQAMQDSDGAQQGNEREVEIYLSGNVVMRYGAGSDPEDKVMRAEQVYYDVNKNKALALNADLELSRPDLRDPAHFFGREIKQLSQEEFLVERSQVAASKLPSDPGIDLSMRQVRVTEEKEQIRRTIFGLPFIDRFTGEKDVAPYRRFVARNSFVEVAGVPIMYFPYLAGDVDDPFGPLQSIGFRQDKIMGTQLYTTWSLLELIGIKKLPGERWDLLADYYSKRGPGVGTIYDISANKLFGVEAPFTNHFLAYGVYDKGVDVLGGSRTNEFQPTQWRGRILERYQQQYENLQFQGQFAYLSDHNFLESYYNYEWNYGLNQETFGYLKYQDGIGAVTLLAEPNVHRPWVAEAQWLPKVEGSWLGQSLFDRLTYNTWASAGYANLVTYNLPQSQVPADVNAVTLRTNEVPLATGRFDWFQQINAPFSAGAVKVVPYANIDLTDYTEDYAGQNRGRFYGGGGVRTSLPFSRLYEGVDSDLLNLHGIYHKVSLNANYYNAWSNTPYYLLPQLDRLNDDATQQSWRDVTPWQQTYNPGPVGSMLLNSPLYDPRQYAIRRLLDDRVDTLDTVQVLQAEVSQRWQTKRGYPGMEHTVDYITFDLSASFFPAKNRDNFGHPVSFVEWNGTWAVGDRNGFTTAGWIDPFAFGTHYWNVGAYANRPDGTNLSLTYRQFEPIGSKAVTASVSYIFSPKYAVTFSAFYDFGISNQESTSLMLSRVGTDLTWSFGFTYNAIVNNFGVTFMVVPNLLGSRLGTTPGSSNAVFGNQQTMSQGRQ
jgi:hypothetical protein